MHITADRVSTRHAMLKTAEAISCCIIPELRRCLITSQIKVQKKKRIPPDISSHSTVLMTAWATVSVMAATGTVAPSCERRHAHQRRATRATSSRNTQDAINAACSPIFIDGLMHVSQWQANGRRCWEEDRAVPRRLPHQHERIPTQVLRELQPIGITVSTFILSALSLAAVKNFTTLRSVEFKACYLATVTTF